MVMTVRVSFDKALVALQHDILKTASLVEKAIYDSVQALVKQDMAAAAQVIMGDDMIDNLCLEIEDRCIKLIATQQPMARDLRIAITGIKILVSLERMGDHCVDIARATMCLSGLSPVVETLDDIRLMADLARQMVKEGLDAYVNNDVDTAREMCAKDDEVDYIFAKIFRDLLAVMSADSGAVVQSAYLLYVSRYLERIADQATNVGEAVIYLVTGERGELN